MIEWNQILNQLPELILKLVHFGLIIGTIVVILLDNRNPVKTLAWILVLIFLPIVGLVFYFFFGRTSRRERIISKKSYGSLLKRPLAKFQEQELTNLPPQYERLIRLFWETTHAFLFDCNQVEIYTNGYSKLSSLISELYKAKKHIHLQYYIFQDDEVGKLIKDVLIDKAKEGVEIRVLTDDVGCWEVSNSFYDEMRDAGIEVRSFLKVRFPLFTSKVNYRNHRKIVVIDGQVGFIGGMNLANRYVKGFSWGNWRDTHLMIRGKAVHGLQTSFLLDWYFVDQTLLTDSTYFPPIDCYKEGALVQTVTSNPIGDWKEIMQGLAMAITNSKRYIYIQTPYFLPTEAIMGALQIAALSGVDVRLMIPERSDSKFTHWATRSYLKDVLKAGVKVYSYQKGFLHSKLMVSDDALATVGSTNMDFRSFEHNFEINAFIYDEMVAQRMKEVFIHDQRDCRQLSLRQWQKRPIHQRFIESLVRLMSPLL